MGDATQPMMMKTRILTLGNAALYLATCALIGTGLLLELRMDSEDGAARLFGMGQDDWAEIHFVIALGFVALTILHLLLNWAWIKVMLKKSKWAASLLLTGLALIACLLLWPASQAASNEGKSERLETDND